MGIKTESTTPVRDSTPNNSEASSWLQTKQKLVEKLASLQSENQQNFLKLKAKEVECATQIGNMKIMEQQLGENNISHSKEVSALKTELLNIKKEMSEQKTNYEKKNSNLTQEIQKLNAQIKQLRKGLDLRSANYSDNDDSEETYEVEHLLKHKKTKCGIQYLVRWKGFSSDDDLWVKESNLQCPKILKAYKITAGLK